MLDFKSLRESSVLPIAPKPSHLPQAMYDKIVEDVFDEGLKNEFLAACEKCDCELSFEPGTRSVEAVYIEFTRDHQQTGTPVALSEGERLGRVTNLRNTSEYIALRLRQDVADVEQMFDWLNEVSDPPPTRRQISVAAEWLEDLKAVINPDTGEKFAVSPSVCWLFRSQEGGNDAYEVMRSVGDCLPCRLGLPDLLNEDEVYETGLEYLCLVVSEKGVQNPRLSNFCHGGYIGVRDIWAPGGSTVPIPYGPADCVVQGGLPEIVSDAVGYSSLDGPVRIVRT